jgi:hypothetical protein
MTAPAIAASMASPASLLGVLFHHGSERLDSRPSDRIDQS